MKKYWQLFITFARIGLFTIGGGYAMLPMMQSAKPRPALTFTYALLPLAFKALAAGLLWRWRHSLELSP